MARHGKKFNAAQEKIDAKKVYTITEAVEAVKAARFAKFNETVCVSFKLGLDPKQADQQIRGAMVLPNGTGKDKVVLAITHNEEAAKNAGADFVGGKEMLDKIKNENWFGFDVIVATPDMMGELGKMGKILGPKGLMPNPKTGTVSPDIAKAIAEQKAGKVNYRLDREANMHVICGQVEFPTEKLVENIKAICGQIIRVKPAACKGTYIRNCVLSSTMGPAIKMNPEAE
jgi:large subunit ribosomal protein L1